MDKSEAILPSDIETALKEAKNHLTLTKAEAARLQELSRVEEQKVRQILGQKSDLESAVEKLEQRKLQLQEAVKAAETERSVKESQIHDMKVEIAKGEKLLADILDVRKEIMKLLGGIL